MAFVLLQQLKHFFGSLVLVTFPCLFAKRREVIPQSLMVHGTLCAFVYQNNEYMVILWYLSIVCIFVSTNDSENPMRLGRPIVAASPRPWCCSISNTSIR